MAANPFLPVIFAADPWDFIIGAIVFFFWLIGQFVGSREEAKPKPRRPRPQPNPARDVDEPVVVMLDEENKPIHPPVQDQAESLRSEIEEFVRRAQGKPAQQKPAPQKPAA
ncbi:MAG: hypothetical protein MI725_03205, partial [Pirellulales bacterium]|nr:hypothetical protein [Pirellulales bacterium]